MRLASSIIVLIASWLLAAPSAEAATAHGGSKKAHRSHSCKQKAAYGHPPRHLGPLRQSIAERAGLGDTRAVLKHGHHARQDDDDDAVIQNNVPADRIDDGRRAAPTLLPIGTLASSHTALPSDRILTRRSPRGPPLS